MKQAVSIFALTVLLASTVVNGLPSPVLSNKRQYGNQVGQSQQENVNGDNLSNQNQISGAMPNAEHLMNNGLLMEPDASKMPGKEHLMNNGLLMEPDNAPAMPDKAHLMNNGMLMEPDNSRMPDTEHLMNNGHLMEPSG